MIFEDEVDEDQTADARLEAARLEVAQEACRQVRHCVPQPSDSEALRRFSAAHCCCSRCDPKKVFSKGQWDCQRLFIMGKGRWEVNYEKCTWSVVSPLGGTKLPWCVPDDPNLESEFLRGVTSTAQTGFADDLPVAGASDRLLRAREREQTRLAKMRAAHLARAELLCTYHAHEQLRRENLGANSRFDTRLSDDGEPETREGPFLGILHRLHKEQDVEEDVEKDDEQQDHCNAHRNRQSRSRRRRMSRKTMRKTFPMTTATRRSEKRSRRLRDRQQARRQGEVECLVDLEVDREGTVAVSIAFEGEDEQEDHSIFHCLRKEQENGECDEEAGRSQDEEERRRRRKRRRRRRRRR
jgi:hypothetical protein